MGDVIIFGNGKARPKTEGEIPIYGGNGILGYCDQFNYQDETIIIGRVGAYCGSVFYKNKPIWVSDNALSAKPKERNNTKFLFYFLKNLELNQFAEGSSHPLVTQTLLNSIDIEIPEKETEQKAIASVLSSLDDKIDLLHRQNKTLEAMAETLFRQWFVEEAEEDWEEKPLSFFGDIICGKTPSKKIHSYFNGKIPFIKIPDMHGNIFVFETFDSLTEEGMYSQSNKTLPSKSICVSCIATVGLVSMNAIESQTNQQINSIIPKKEYHRYFLYFFMKSYYDLLHSMACGGTATLNLNTGSFSKIPVPYPGNKILLAFQAQVQPFFDKIFTSQKQIRTLEKLRNTLLPKLMSGEVRVEYDAN
ncbi:hypothetical protein DK28_0205265 [Peptococcaceae bacterium SCADC1_2_3]|nr:hypothetical protein DK28_0205265 [Peptococcaceae bacterium SCADC1_2_3]KFI36164.1 hypothetical protein HY00_05965 [Peptococcaceae bacterium SCADC1_2_3]